MLRTAAVDKNMRFAMSKRPIIAAVAFAVLASATGLFAGDRPAITPKDLLSGEVLGVTDDPTTGITAKMIFALDDEMRAFLAANVNPGATDVFKLEQLIDAIMGENTFGLQYDENTRTAAETFHLKLGNCLSFSTMFISLARGVGLQARFQEVDIPPDWSMRKDVYVLNRHVNVNVDLGAGGVHVVDFNISDFKSTYDIEVVSDKRAIAQFFNNLGVERMQDGEVDAAVAFFRRAITEGDGKFSPAWTNLGSLYRKFDHLDHAEAAYLQALKTDKTDLVAMSNLVRLYEMMGDAEKAEIYQKRVEEHRMNNPYYRFGLAREAFFKGDYPTAIEHLKHAIRRHKDDDEFYFLLGLCYLMNGNEQEARRWTSKAEEVAATEQDRRRYSTKIEALMSAPEKVD
jgi:Flp pilus assembly protein TadD